MTAPKTDYEKKSFSVAAGGSESYRDGWERVFGKVAERAVESVQTVVAALPDPLAPREHMEPKDEVLCIPERLQVVVHAASLQQLLRSVMMTAENAKLVNAMQRTINDAVWFAP